MRTSEYVALAKWGFLLGVSLFVLGGVGEILAHTVASSVPAWLETTLFGMEAVGLLVGLTSPFVFGIFLPLLE